MDFNVFTETCWCSLSHIEVFLFIKSFLKFFSVNFEPFFSGFVSQSNKDSPQNFSIHLNICILMEFKSKYVVKLYFNLLQLCLLCQTLSCVKFVQTPLFCAAAEGKVNVVEFLLRNGADINSPSVCSNEKERGRGNGRLLRQIPIVLLGWGEKRWIVWFLSCHFIGSFGLKFGIQHDNWHCRE